MSRMSAALILAAGVLLTMVQNGPAYFGVWRAWAPVAFIVFSASLGSPLLFLSCDFFH
jgi:hypothetical protein